MSFMRDICSASAYDVELAEQLDIRSESAFIYIKELKSPGEIGSVSRNVTSRICARDWLVSGVKRGGRPFDSEKYG